jgi:xanthine dehydrogenase accessory factor
MESSDQEVVQSALAWLERGQPVWLVTVAATWGSSPRPPGSLLAIGGEGSQAGSVSGGCVEEDLVERVCAGEFSTPGPRRVDYGVTREQGERFGLPCGGRLRLVLEPLEAPTQLETLLRAMRERRVLERRLCLNTGEVSLHPAGPDAEFRCDDNNLVKPFGPRWQLLIIGAGQVARYLAPIARSLDYRVLIGDPRAEYHTGWDLGEVELVRDMPDDLVSARGDDPRTAVVALTHDPKLDDMALMTALESRAFYVGALGSRDNNRRRRHRLLELGLKPEAVARLRGPVGLPLGGKTPPEIAVAIAAELTAVRHGRHLDRVEG